MTPVTSPDPSAPLDPGAHQPPAAAAPTQRSGSSPAHRSSTRSSGRLRHAATSRSGRVDPVSSESPSVGELVKDASTQLSTLVRGEIELAKLEIGTSVKNAGLGIGLVLGALVLLVFALTFGLIALAEGLVAAHIWRWAAYLMVFGLLLLLTGAFVFVGLRIIKRVKAPRRTIETTRETVALLTHPTSGNS